MELLPPKNKYEKGQEYKIELGESNIFVDEGLGYADNLIVIIDKVFKEFYTFTDNVKEIEGVLESRIRLFTELTLHVLNENISHIGSDNGAGIGVNGHTSDKIEVKKGDNSNKENVVYVLMNVFSK